MALTNSYVNVYGQLPEVFARIADAQAPEKFTRQYLQDLGFGSSNYRAVIPLLKTLGFLSEDGAPTNRYHEYRNTAQSRQILGEALREAYGDLFTIKAKPTPADRELIEGKFRSAHNTSPNTAKLMASTFYSLLDLADISDAKPQSAKEEIKIPATPPMEPKPADERTSSHPRPTLHYNIQIHLPATKDIEVFNAIFTALRAHLL